LSRIDEIFLPFINIYFYNNSIFCFILIIIFYMLNLFIMYVFNFYKINDNFLLLNWRFN